MKVWVGMWALLLCTLMALGQESAIKRHYIIAKQGDTYSITYPTTDTSCHFSKNTPCFYQFLFDGKYLHSADYLLAGQLGLNKVTYTYDGEEGHLKSAIQYANWGVGYKPATEYQYNGRLLMQAQDLELSMQKEMIRVKNDTATLSKYYYVTQQPDDSDSNYVYIDSAYWVANILQTKIFHYDTTGKLLFMDVMHGSDTDVTAGNPVLVNDSTELVLKHERYFYVYDGGKVAGTYPPGYGFEDVNQNDEDTPDVTYDPDELKKLAAMSYSDFMRTYCATDSLMKTIIDANAIHINMDDLKINDLPVSYDAQYPPIEKGTYLTIEIADTKFLFFKME